MKVLLAEHPSGYSTLVGNGLYRGEIRMAWTE